MNVRLTMSASRRAGEESSWLLDVDEATTVGEVAESLGVSPEAIVPSATATTALVESGLLSGSVIPPRDAPEPEPGTVRLEIIGGPFAGTSIPLERGQAITIGSGEQVDLRIADPALAPAHLGVHIAQGRRDDPLLAMISPGPDAEVLVNGTRIGDAERIVPADLVQIGSVMLRIGLAPVADADLTPVVGGRGFNRPSRVKPDAPQPVIQLPGDKPQDQDQSPLPWLSAVIPVVMGVTMAMVFQRPIMLMMAAASPIMVVGSFLTQRRLARKKGVKTEQQWIDEIKKAGERVRELIRSQRLERWYALPDPVVIRDIALRPMSRLWERRKSDADAMRLRVGISETDLDVRFEGGGKDRADARAALSPVPVAVDLRDGPVGVAGRADAVRSLARAMVTSLATLRSPRETEIVVICDDGEDAEWQWVQWLPHAQTGTATAFIGNDDDTRRERVREVATALETRLRLSGQRGFAPPTDVLLVVDGARRFRMLPGMVPILEHGAAMGVHVLALDSDRSRLPEEATSVVLVDVEDPSLASLETPHGFFPTVLIDGCSIANADRIARSLCSIEHVSGVGDEAMLPTSVRMVDLLDIDLDDPGYLVRRWSAQPRNTFVVVGANADGEFAIDISRDGPHALVAGTTGSGKSEFLQALVVSLAMSNRPDALNFVLVDYKGGSAFADCERLPHTVGMVTNLDARETERALASLDAELKRREQVLRDLGAKDIDAAWAKDPETSAQRGLARLMIVIDEFAELRTELPDFIDGLVRIARVGRSLGVNLVLATQRPSGVITAEMQSNINLRVALRVTDRTDSTDVIGTGDAALISSSTPGRGFVRAGTAQTPQPFQTARVAGIRPGVQRSVKVLPPKAPIDWDSVGYAPRFPVTQKVENHDHDDTDLRALVDLITAATEEMGIPKNPSPWLLPLPTNLPLARLAQEHDDLSRDELYLGLEDVPSQQAQRTLRWNLVTGSHLLFIGGGRSGRTTALRAIAAQAVRRFSPGDLHLYVLDYGNGALLPMADAPHCGAVVTPLDPDRLPRLIQRLLEELAHRQGVLSAAGVGDISEQRRKAGADALPYLMVMVDGWERMLSTMNPDQLVLFRDQFMRILREGPAVGVRVAMTADRGMAGDKVSGFFDEQYILPLRDVNDYRAAGVLARDIPVGLPAGRVLFGPDAKEAQLVVLDRDTSGEAQTVALRRIVDDVRDAFEASDEAANVVEPFRVDPMPKYMALTASYELPVAPGMAANGITVAVGGDRLSRFTIDWPDDGGFVVAGGRRSGRSTALATIAHQLAWREFPVLVVSMRESVLTEVARAAKAPVIARSDMTPAELEEAVAGLGRRFAVIVDDAEQIKNAPLEHALTGIKDRAHFVVAADIDALSTLFGGPIVEAKRSRKGLVLRPTQAMQGTQAVGAAIPKFMLGEVPAGGGVVTTPHGWIQARVPDVTQ